MAIWLVHSKPPRVQPPSEPSTFVTPVVQPTIQYYRSSEVPGEVGCLVDVWDARAYTPYTILNMLLLNNVIVPPEYVFRRVGLVHVASDSNLRSTYCGDRDFSSPQAQHVGEEEEREVDPAGADRQSWESQIEFWYNERQRMSFGARVRGERHRCSPAWLGEDESQGGQLCNTNG
jgi:hypothetical protein